MEIKLVEDKDFLELARLTVEMYKEVNPEVNEFQATNTLVTLIGSNSFVAIGLYEDGVLLGCVTGCKHAGTVFYFSGIYMSVRNTEWTQKLIEYSFEHIKGLGFTAWEAEAGNNNIASILEKYGATKKSVRYRKEFDK